MQVQKKSSQQKIQLPKIGIFPKNGTILKKNKEKEIKLKFF